MPGVGIGLGSGGGGSLYDVARNVVAGVTANVTTLPRQLQGSTFDPSKLTGPGSITSAGVVSLTAPLAENGTVTLLVAEVKGDLLEQYGVTLTGIVLAGTLGPTTGAFSNTSAPGAVLFAFTGLATGEKVTSIAPSDNKLALSSDGRSCLVGLSQAAVGSASYTFTTSTGRPLTTAFTITARAPSLLLETAGYLLMEDGSSSLLLEA